MKWIVVNKGPSMQSFGSKDDFDEMSLLTSEFISSSRLLSGLDVEAFCSNRLSSSSERDRVVCWTLINETNVLVPRAVRPDEHLLQSPELENEVTAGTRWMIKTTMIEQSIMKK
jgi:hypothetical protein